MPVLHTIHTLADHCAALSDCIRVLEQNDALVFMEEAATDLRSSFLSQHRELSTCQCAIYLLPLDNAPAAQGKLAEVIKVITYQEFVDLCCHYPIIQNWY